MFVILLHVNSRICFCRVFHEVAKIAPLSKQEMDLLQSSKTSGRSAVRYSLA